WNRKLSDARALEGRIQQSLQDLTRFISQLDNKSVDNETQTSCGQIITDELESLLQQYKSMVEELTTISETANDSTASMIVKRQKSVYRDFYREFNRQHENMQVKLERMSLLRQSAIRSITKEESEMQQLLKERASARSSLQMADRFIEQAAESHSNLLEQGRRLEAGKGRILSVSSRFPLANDLLNRIADRRNRENVIVAVVIACCIIFCIW
ncbi:hypothetical protein WA556_006181, partial [Blastocystis sp. ATCC 50177/Nand II]